MEGLKLKLQYFGHLMQRADSLDKTLILGKIEDRRRRGWQRMRWLDGITHSLDMNFGKVQEMVRDREACHAAVHGVTKSWTQLGDWTTITRWPHLALITSVKILSPNNHPLRSWILGLQHANVRDMIHPIIIIKIQGDPFKQIALGAPALFQRCPPEDKLLPSSPGTSSQRASLVRMCLISRSYGHQELTVSHLDAGGGHF